VNFNNTWSSLVNNTIPTLLPISRFNNTMNSYLSKTEASSTYVSNVYITGLSIGYNNTINNILNNIITANSDIGNIKSTLPNLLLINNFNNTISSYLQTNNFNNTINNYLLTNNFNNTINNFLQTNNFNNTIR
jgi:hypothetical protein